MDDCDQRELAAAYALGALDDSERQEYERHLATCSVCARELDGLRDSLLALAHAGGEELPPPHLRARVIAAVERESLSAPVVSQRRRIPRWSFALVPAVAAAIAAVIVLTGSSTPAPLQALGGHYSTTALRGAGGQPAGDVYVSLTGKTVALTRLPAAPGGKVYEAWVMVGGDASRAEPAGLFHGGGKQYVTLARIAHPGDIVGFTLEPSGGSPHPTTQPLATARI